MCIDFNYDSSGKLLTHELVKKSNSKRRFGFFMSRRLRGRRALSTKKISDIGCSGGRCRGHNNPLASLPLLFLRSRNGLISRGSSASEDLALGISIGSESSPSSAFLYDDASVFVPVIRDYKKQQRLFFYNDRV